MLHTFHILWMIYLSFLFMLFSSFIYQQKPNKVTLPSLTDFHTIQIVCLTFNLPQTVDFQKQFVVIVVLQHMINRFDEIKGGDYTALVQDQVQIRQIKYSIMEDMGDQIRNSNNTLEDIKKNQNKMTQIINKYKKEANPKGQKHYLEQFNSYEQENRDCFRQLKNNIDQMITITGAKTKSQKQTKSAQVLRYEQQMKQCLNVQLDQSSKIKLVIEEKKERLEKSLPPGTTSQNLQRLITNTTSQKVKNAAEDLRDKLKQLDKLAASIRQCKQLLDDINIYLKAGTGQINVAIEKNKQAKQYLERGNEQIRKAIDNQKKSRTRRFIIIIVAIIVLAAIGFVLFKFVPWN